MQAQNEAVHSTQGGRGFHPHRQPISEKEEWSDNGKTKKDGWIMQQKISTVEC